MEESRAKAEFLRTKVPEYRKRKPGFKETDLFIDDVIEEYDQIWPLCDVLWPNFDIGKDNPVTHSMCLQFCEAFKNRRIVSTPVQLQTLTC